MQTITLATVLPALTKPTVIDGTTQAGASCGTLVPDDGSGAITNSGHTAHSLMVAINASAITTASVSILSTTATADASTIKGLDIYGATGANTVFVNVASPNTTVTCNYIGPKEDGISVPTLGATIGIGFSWTTANNIVINNNLIAGTKQYYITQTVNGGNSGAKISNNLLGTDVTGVASLQSGGANVTANYAMYSGTTSSSFTNYEFRNNVFANATRLLSLNVANTSTIAGNYYGIGLDGKTTTGFSSSATTYAISGGKGLGLTIGGTNAADRNYFGGVANAVSIANGGSTGDLTIQNNNFGLGIDGTTATPNTSVCISTTSVLNHRVIGNTIVNCAGGGVNSTSDTNPVIQGNYVGVTPSGTAMKNNGGGISIVGTGTGAKVGGTGAGEGNVLSGNSTSYGLSIAGTTSNTTVQGNIVGLAPDGVTKVANTNGISISGNPTNVIIGGNTTAARNIISGNSSTGIASSVVSPTTAGNIKIQGNYIGPDKNGAAVTGAAGRGIQFINCSGTTIGGDSTAGEGNVIAGNQTDGIYTSTTTINLTVQGNIIGLAPDGVTKLANNYGINLTGTSTNVMIGGNTAAVRNIISGNASGGITSAATLTGASNIAIKGNYIGPDKNGAKVTGLAASSFGISMQNVNGTQIGGDRTAGEGNVISGNASFGMQLTGSGATTSYANVGVYGNNIGVAPDGVTALGNGGFGMSASATLIGGALQIGGAGTGQSNIIVNNTTGSVSTYGLVLSGAAAAATPIVVKSNYIGILPNGTSMGNALGGGVNVNGVTGLQIGGTGAGEGNVISGNAASTSTSGITMVGTTQEVTIQGNIIGLTPDGLTAAPNTYGISISGGTPKNITIGGNTAAARNIISGNVGRGVSITTPTTGTSAIKIQGNYLGTDKNGDVLAVANRQQDGSIYLNSPNGVLVGGDSTAGEGNVISGGSGYGIFVSGGGPMGNNFQIYGNTIGLKPDNETPAGNVQAVYFYSTSNFGGGSPLIGGVGQGQGNIISSNRASAIYLSQLYSAGSTNPLIIRGNKIGVSASGAARGNTDYGIAAEASNSFIVGGINPGEGNIIANNKKSGVQLTSSNKVPIRGNNFYGNTALGIDITNATGNKDLPNPNDAPSALDADTGGNDMQNYPQQTVLTKCDGSTGQAAYLWSAANTTYAIDFYANPSGYDSTGYGEGEQYVSSASVTTDATGYAAVTIPAGITNPSMTATDPSGNTSEFGNIRNISTTNCGVTSKTTNDTTPSLAGSVTLSGFATGEAPTTATTSVNGQTPAASFTSPNWTLADNTLTALSEGTYDVGATITDPISKLSSSYTTTGALTIDLTPPTITVNQAPDQADPTNVNSIKFEVVASEPISGLTTSDFTVSGSTGAVASLIYSGNNTYVATVNSATSGDVVTLSIPASRFNDTAGNTNTAASTSTDNQVTYDATKPTAALARRTGQVAYTTANSAWFTITLSEPAASGTLTASDVNLGTTTGLIDGFTKIDATHCEFEVTGMSSGDTVTPSIAPGLFTDTAGNTSNASTSDGNTWVTYDITPPNGFAVNVDVESPGYSMEHPKITWSTTDDQSGIDHYTISVDDSAFATATSPYETTLASTPSHTIIIRAYDKAGNYTEKEVEYPPIETINAPVTLSNQPITNTTIRITGPAGMKITNVSITGAGSSGFTCTPTPGATTTVPIDCTGGQITSTGTLTVAATTDAGVTTSNSQDYVIDTVMPTVTVNQASTQADPTNTNSASFTVIFSEAVKASTFTADDLSVSGTNGTVTGFTQVDSRTWTATVTGMTDGDTASVGLKANKVTDLAGNNNEESTSDDNTVTYDSTPPGLTVEKASGQADPTNVNSADFVVTFSEPVTGLLISNIALSGSGTAYVDSVTEVSPGVYAVHVTNMTDGDTITVSVKEDVTTDLAGNDNTESTSTDNSVSYDATPPTVTINQSSGQADPTNVDSASFDIEFSEDVSTLDVSQITLNGTANGSIALTKMSARRYKAVVSGMANGETVSISLDASAVVDAAGNGNTVSASTDSSVTFDNETPTGTVNSVAPSITNSPEFTGTVDDPTATVIVTINGIDYTATNNGNGTWSLPAGTINPGLGAGDYAVAATIKDTAGNQSTAQTSVTILRADADLPTVNPVTNLGGTPIITGTYDSENSLSLTVTVNGIAYVLGANPELAVDGNNWTLDLRSISPSLPNGKYDIKASVTTRDGSILTDTTTSELTIKPLDLVTALTNPGATLARTGTPVWAYTLLAVVSVIASVLLFARNRKRRHTRDVI